MESLSVPSPNEMVVVALRFESLRIWTILMRSGLLRSHCLSSIVPPCQQQCLINTLVNARAYIKSTPVCTKDTNCNRCATRLGTQMWDMKPLH